MFANIVRLAYDEKTFRRGKRVADRFTGIVVLVTDGDSGIGEATLKAFAQEGAKVAKVVLFLASDEVPFVTGAASLVDGGLTAHTGILPLTGEW